MQKIKKRAQDIYKELYETATNETFNGGCEAFPYYNAKELGLYLERETTTTAFPPTTTPYDENSTAVPIYPPTPDPSYLPLDENWRRYYRVPISLAASAIHVPTNIFHCGKWPTGKASKRCCDIEATCEWAR